MMAALAPIIPGAAAWPKFTRNRSEQFEARLSLVEVLASPSLFFTGMAGSRLPIAVAHGEGFADFSQRGDAAAVQRAMRFVDNHGRPTEAYPSNPNGSPDGLTAVTTADGRFTALMPHPERVFRNVQMSWTSGDRGGAQPVDAHVPQRAARLRLTDSVGNAAPGCFRPKALQPFAIRLGVSEQGRPASSIGQPVHRGADAVRSARTPRCPASNFWLRSRAGSRAPSAERSAMKSRKRACTGSTRRAASACRSRGR